MWQHRNETYVRKIESGEDDDKDITMFKTTTSKNKERMSQMHACYEVVLQPKCGLLETCSQTETWQRINLSGPRSTCSEKPLWTQWPLGSRWHLYCSHIDPILLYSSFTFEYIFWNTLAGLCGCFFNLGTILSSEKGNFFHTHSHLLSLSMSNNGIYTYIYKFSNRIL